MAKKLHKKYLKQLLKKDSNACHGVLNVRPMHGRYIWVNEQLPRPFEGTIVFDAKGSNDICLCFHDSCSTEVTGRDGLAEGAPIYEILVGGWSNSKTAIRKHGQQQAFVSKDMKESAAIQDEGEFLRYWVTLHGDCIYVGSGEVGSHEILQWRDPQPAKDVVHIGVSSWNTALQFKNLSVTSAVVPCGHFTFNGDTLLHTSVLADVVVRVGGVDLALHAAVLHSWSRLFLEQGLGVDGRREKEGEEAKMAVDWDALDPDLFMDMMAFIYTGELQEDVDERSLFGLTAIFGIEAIFRQYMLASAGLATVSHHTHSPRGGTRSRSSSVGSSSSSSSALAYRSYRQLLPRIVRYRRLFLNPLYSDVTFVLVDDPSMPKLVAHRVVLAMWSEPFLAMFSNSMKESSEREIHLHEAMAGPFRALLEFCYCGKVDLNPEHAISVLFLADRFQVVPLREFCSDLVRQYIDVDNCCSLMRMADHFSWKSILANCMRFLESNFQRVSKQEDFLGLPPLRLIQLLLSDNLLVSDESMVFEASLRWCQHHFGDAIDAWLAHSSAVEAAPGKEATTATSSNQELSHEAGLDYDDLQIAEDLLSCVRYPLMGEEYLLETVQRHPLFQTRPSLAALTEEALVAKVGEEEERPHVNFRHQSRAASHYRQLLYSHSGDKNGVCYFVGCSYGTSVWANPHKAGRLVASMSSPPTKYTKPEAIVNRSFSSTNFCTGNPHPWAAIELLDGHKLICNYYWLRQDGGDSFLRTWTLQGSNDPDLDGWTDLRVHVADPTICQPGQNAAWPVFGKAARTPFRSFRLVAQGPAYNGQHHLAVCGFELYGYFA